DTVVLLAGLLRRPARHPLVFAGALRQPGLDPRGPLALFIDRLAGDGRMVTIELEPLDAEQTATLATALLDHPPDAVLVAAVHEQSNGNPFFAVQTILDLVEAGAIETDGSTSRLAGLGSAGAAGATAGT